MPQRPGKRVIDRINANIMEKIVLHPRDTGRITGEVSAVRTDTVNFYVYSGDGAVICFDAGYRRMLIAGEMKKLGLDPGMVTHVFLTHADIDHSLGLRLFRNAEVYLSHAEKERLSGIRPPRQVIRSPRIRRPYKLLRDGDVVSAGGATVRAIETPGHTPGSMAFLLNGEYLFTGDTCKFADGVAYAGSRYTLDIRRQEESIRKLAQLQGVRYVFTAHSGWTDDFDTAFGCWK